MASSTFKELRRKYNTQIVFVLALAVLMFLVVLSALLFHIKGIPVYPILFLGFGVLLASAYYTARRANHVVVSVASTAILGALFVGIGFQLFIKLHVYTFWFQTIQALNYMLISLAVAAVGAIIGVFGAQIAFRRNYRAIEEKRRERYKNRYGENMPHPDFIKSKTT
ncbi:MAG: hypothetical protein LAT75_11015 [Candidatus Cyclonatronum sp.]|uniref:hypothetical protein n=1 Tax=Cyclonatronum sp. TaxID=3024185 RepID=UPI0025B805EA|nr:hypothetical protein [Cyclonatronum sp.]MCC5934582.1 hypothetical protein [Balneolales bacterium]MCH8487385.1 hypothetical protein [Cyclonatronum sp.]